jgi:tetratricopeptide (TPR) repeat protein
MGAAWLLTLVLLARQGPELVSPLGRELFARPDTGGLVARAESVAALHAGDADSLFALGLAYARIWRYRDAVAAHTRALALAPGRAVLYRHRGHRYISLRRFPEAVADLERAAALDSASFDIWYHLGLAYYLTARFGDAAEAYARCRAVARTADDTVAASDWLWMSLRRSGREPEAAAVAAAIGEGRDVRDNAAYYARLLFYAGRRSEADLRALMARGDLEFATVGYGLANWLLVQGEREPARELFRQVVAGAYWPAFGFIAAEVELLRMEAEP